MCCFDGFAASNKWIEECYFDSIEGGFLRMRVGWAKLLCLDPEDSYSSNTVCI